MASEINLSTSLTLQFMLAQSTYPNVARPSNDRPNIQLVQRVLSLPLQAICFTCGRSHTYRLPINESGNGNNRRKWTIEIDPTIAPTIAEIDSLGADQKYFHFHGIEIKSRIFDKAAIETETEGSHTHSVNMKGEITTVLTQLQQRLSKLYRSSQIWLFPSTNCGISLNFHNGTTGFPLTTTKKVVYMMIAWQHLFDSLHATHRIAERPLFDPGLDVHLDAWLQQIKKAPGLQSLTELLTGARAAGIIDIKLVSEKGPIAFNQLAGTFHPAAVLSWIDVLTKVITRAHYAEGTFFAWQFSPDGEYRAPTYDTWSMLRDLHVKRSTINHYRSPTRDTFAQIDEDLASAVQSTATGDLLGPLALQVANMALATGNHGRIGEMITKKMRTYGYGRYNRGYIEAVENHMAPKTQPTKTTSPPTCAKAPRMLSTSGSLDESSDDDAWVVV